MSSAVCADAGITLITPVEAIAPTTPKVAAIFAKVRIITSS
jgi:hypothetical protein